MVNPDGRRERFLRDYHENTREELKRKIWLKNKPIEILPRGVDLDLFKPLEKNIARKKLGFSNSDKIVIFNNGGDKSELKGLMIAEKTVHLAKIYNNNIRLIVLNGEIPPNKMPLYYNASDAMLLCSDSEGSPTSIKEALACNVPVVSVDVGDTNEIVNGINNSYICKQDSEELSVALYNVLNKNVKKNFNGRYLIKRYDQKLLTSELIKFYKKVIHSYSKGRGLSKL